MEDKKTHWERIYTENLPDEVSWYQTEPTISLRLIEATGIDKSLSIIDVGGGESILVDSLLKRNFKNIAVLDISGAALAKNQQRLGEQAQKVEWIESDISTFRPKHKVDCWHDRAVLHFLTEEQDRQRYLSTLKETLNSGGHLIVATFAIGGPKQCSGLNIVQYDSESLCRFFGNAFELKETETEIHRTPWDTEQKFVYCRFQRRLAGTKDE